MQGETSDNGDPLRIALATAQLSRLSGGLAESVPILAAALREAGAEAAILGVRDRRAPPEGGFAGPHVHAHEPLGPRVFGAARGFAASFARLRPDVIDTQHLWMFPSLAALRRHRRAGTALVVTPRGMLDPWAVRRAGVKKRLVRLWFEDAHLAAARCLRALNPAEAAAIRAYGYRGPVFTVPNAVPLPPEPGPPGEAPRTLLFLGRLDPKKGIAELIDAWAIMTREGAAAGWQLQVTGAGPQDYVAALRRRAGDGVVFTGDLRGEAKAESFARASAFILPSLSEGLPMSVLEAWASARPVLMTEAGNLPEGFAARAAVRIGTEPSRLAREIGEFLALPPERLAEMGARGRALVADRFTPDAMAAAMLRIYRWAAGRGEAPADLAHDGIGLAQ